MTLDIRYTDKAPNQYRHVRMTTVYTDSDATLPTSEIVIHFYDNLYPQVNIRLSDILSVTTTND